MKIRSGFVSNSSSASFLLVWQNRSLSAEEMFEENKPVDWKERLLERSLVNLFELSWAHYTSDGDINSDCLNFYDWETERLIFREDMEFDGSVPLEVIKKIIKNTEVSDNGIFKTKKLISMMNSFADFGEEIILLMSFLGFDQGFDKQFNTLHVDIQGD